MKIVQKTEISYDATDIKIIIEDVIKTKYPDKEIKITFNSIIEYNDAIYDRTGHPVFNGCDVEIV
ncbi:MAG: hypothetical protein WC679_01230 [Bacteroidales bacterium]|jgi:hypothetical protein